MSHFTLVHGAWGGSWVYRDLVRALERRGHRATILDLPGHGDDPTPVAGVTHAAYVDRVLASLAERGEPTLLVGHSLAGSVITSVAERAPQLVERAVYLCAFLPQSGQSPLELMKSDPDGQLLSRLEFSADGSRVSVPQDAVRAVLLSDLDEEALREAAPRFAVDQATEPFSAAARVTDERFGRVPKSYLRTSLDRVLSPALQDRMIAAHGVSDVRDLAAGHFPLLSVPSAVADALHLIAAEPAAIP